MPNELDQFALLDSTESSDQLNQFTTLDEETALKQAPPILQHVLVKFNTDLLIRPKKVLTLPIGHMVIGNLFLVIIEDFDANAFIQVGTKENPAAFVKHLAIVPGVFSTWTGKDQVAFKIQETPLDIFLSLVTTQNTKTESGQGFIYFQYLNAGRI